MAHQSKRPYAGTRSSSQSSITSYFKQGASSSSNPIYETDFNSCQALYALQSQSQNSISSTPSLPHSVQSNLLNVGMRVRKSVPEGYKTGSYSAFTSFGDSLTIPSTSTTSNMSTPLPPARKTRPRSGNRELTPFSGILKVGGMAGQQWRVYNSENGEEMDSSSGGEGEDEVPFLSSQGSTVSMESVDVEAITPGGNKRRFLEDEEGGFANSGSAMNFGCTFGSGLGAGFGTGLGERVLAVPRRKKSKSNKTAAKVRIFGQENLHGGGGEGREDFDFQDAEFLDYELAGEVEMSGCN